MPAPLWDPYAPLEQQAELARHVRHDVPRVADLAHGDQLRRVLRGVSRHDRVPEGLGAGPGPTDSGAVDREVEALLTYVRYVHVPVINYQDIHYDTRARRHVIRTPDQVMAEQLGSCVDLSCLFAAVLLRWKHRPLLVVLDRGDRRHPADTWEAYHMVLGYWRDRTKVRSGRKAVWTHEELMVHCGPTPDDEAVRLVDPTWAAQSDRADELPADFRCYPIAEYLAGRNRLDGRNHRVRYAVDVVEAQSAQGPFTDPPFERPKDLRAVAEVLEGLNQIDLAETVRRIQLWLPHQIEPRLINQCLGDIERGMTRAKVSPDAELKSGIDMFLGRPPTHYNDDKTRTELRQQYAKLAQEAVYQWVLRGTI